MGTEARWQSGYAADCNSVYAGSIPTLASIFLCHARVVELVDTGDLKSPARKSVPVRVRPWAPMMIERNSTLNLWHRLSSIPAGKWLFSRLVCWKAPYFGSIRPRFQTLRPGNSVVTIRKRRSVTNHIGTVHAIAMCNLAEIAAGTMTEVTIPGDYRWIPKGMTVEYLRKAETNLTAVAEISPVPTFDGTFELPVKVSVTDARNQIVFRAVINMWVSPRQ